MNEVVLHVESLSKQYRIGARKERYQTARDAIAGALVGSVRWARRGGRRSAQADSEIWALNDVSFDVRRGDVVGIIGRNGAGKSTLLKILSRITEPTSGYADVTGRVGALLEVGTGFHLELTGRENIYLNAAILGMTQRELNRKFDEIVAFAEVERFIDTPVKHYSTGMHMRLAFSVAAHLTPDILMVDEVLAVGDAAFQQKCLGRMQDVAADSRTVLFVSHNLGAVRQLCTKGLVLSNGRVSYYGPVAEALTHYSHAVSASSAEHDGVAGGLRMRGMAIEPLAGGDRMLDTSEPFRVRTTLDLPDDLIDARLYCLVDDSNGSAIVHHTIDLNSLGRSRLAAGSYSVAVECPALWLIPNAYTVHFKLIGHLASGQEQRCFSERVMLELSDRSGQSAGKVRSLLIPPLHWSITAGHGRPAAAIERDAVVPTL